LLIWPWVLSELVKRSPAYNRKFDFSFTKWACGLSKKV
jgi:hypothetical protein